VHGVSLRQNSYVVEHSNAATMEMQNRRIRRHHQNMHFLNAGISVLAARYRACASRQAH